MLSLACGIGRYSSPEELWADAMRLLDNGTVHPIQWLRNSVPDTQEAMQNYHKQLSDLILDGASWDLVLPAHVFADAGGMAVLPLTVVGFQAKTAYSAGTEQPMTTCWREISKVRLLEVVRSVLVGGRGLMTNTELPHIIVHPSLRDQTVKQLVSEPWFLSKSSVGLHLVVGL